MYPIPANATRIRYLESTGTQYIDTGIDAAVDADMSIDAVSLNTGSTQFHAMGVFSTSSNSGYALFCSSAGMITGSVGSDIRVRANGVNWNTRRLVELKKGELIVDGTSYGLPSPMPTSLLPGNHIWLMGLNGVDITLPSHPGRLYGAKISVGSALVRDFQPVRKNGVGYLFDRVSGQLFGNAGTGSFVLGPDTFSQGVVPTRMMAMGARKKLPTSLDYVQDGLYYQLDGIENAGRGVHSSTATTWTDLTGNGRNATFINAASGLVWQDDAAYLYGKTHDGMAKIRGLPSMTAFTMEIVFRADSVELAGRIFDVENYTSNSESRRFCVNSVSGTDQIYPCIQICNQSNHPFTQLPPCVGISSPIVYSIFPTASGSTVTAANVSANGGAQSETWTYSKSAGTPSNYIDVANRSYNPNRGCDMAVFAIRCYNRVLTDAEIAANYAIDKARFNLP